MSKRTAWAHLPNAHHIDRILNDVKQRSRVWAAAWDEARDVAGGVEWAASRSEAWEAPRSAAWGAAWDAAWGSALGTIRIVAWSTISALIAWDYAGAILDMPPDAVRLLAASGYHPAVLLLPAAIALSTAI